MYQTTYHKGISVEDYEYTHDFSLMLPKNPRLLKDSLPLNPSGQITIFTSLDFPEIKEFPLLNHHFGEIGRVRSL